MNLIVHSESNGILSFCSYLQLNGGTFLRYPAYRIDQLVLRNRKILSNCNEVTFLSRYTPFLHEQTGKQSIYESMMCHNFVIFIYVSFRSFTALTLSTSLLKSASPLRDREQPIQNRSSAIFLSQ